MGRTGHGALRTGHGALRTGHAALHEAAGALMSMPSDHASPCSCPSGPFPSIAPSFLLLLLLHHHVALPS